MVYLSINDINLNALHLLCLFLPALSSPPPLSLFSFFLTHILPLASCLLPVPFQQVPVVVALHHLMADYVTHKHGSGSTAVRATSEKLKVSYFYSKVG
jgi:hypothetical protein